MTNASKTNEQLLQELSKLWQENQSLKEELNSFNTVQKQTQESLKYSESKYKCLFETANDAIFLMDKDVFIDCNQKTLELFGCSKEQIIGHPPADFSPEFQPDKSSSITKSKEYISQAEKGTPQLFEWKHQRKDGTLFDAEVSLNVFYIENQHLALAIVRDITESKKNNLLLSESEKMYKKTQEFAHVGGWEYDIKDQIFWGSDETKRTFEFDLDAKFIMIDEVLERFAEKEEASHRIQQIIKSHEPFNQEFEITTKKSHQKKMIHSIGELVLDEQKNPIRVIGIVRDITEQKMAENALKNTSEMLSLFIKNSPIYAFIKEVTPTDSRALMASKNYIDMIGVSGSDMIGKSMREFFPSDLATQIIEDDWDVASKGIMIERKEELNGRFYKTLKFPIAYNNQNFLAGYTIDITEMHEANEILKHNKEEITRQNSLFMSLLKNLNQGIFMVEAPSGKPLLANEAALNLLGRGILPDATKQNLSELYNAYKASDRTPYPIDKMPIVRGMNGESSYIDDMLIIYPDGTEKLLEIFGSPVLDQKGKPWASLVSFSDITMRKQTEVALRESEARFKSIFIKSPIGISVSDSITGEILQSNPKFEEIIGRTNEEISTINWMGITHPEDLQLDLDKIALVLKGEIQGYQMEKRYIRPDGSIVWVNMTIVPLPVELHEHPHNLCMIEDITDKKNSEMILIKAKEKAEESDRLKSAFLANMSHEIRTPMNGILGFAELLKEPNLSGEKQQEYIQIIEKSGDRMLNIINNIIDISKIEAGQMLTNITEVNINELMVNIYDFFRPEVEHKGLQLLCKNNLSSNIEIIKTDFDKLQSVLTNLIKNAIKYTIQGSIEFGCEKNGEQLNFFVKDTGIGIPKDRQEAVFERFIQADISDIMAHQGAGLGLSISKAYVYMMGGKIWLESEEGKGTTFHFTLPLIN